MAKDKYSIWIFKGDEKILTTDLQDATKLGSKPVKKKELKKAFKLLYKMIDFRKEV